MRNHPTTYDKEKATQFYLNEMNVKGDEVVDSTQGTQLIQDHVVANRSDFACKKTTYGWSYEGHFIMNDGSMMEQNDKDFTHIIKFDVEVTYYTEVNAFDYLTK